MAIRLVPVRGDWAVLVHLFRVAEPRPSRAEGRRRGYARPSRGTGLTFATILIPVVLVHDPLALALLTLACLAFGIYTSNLFVITQSLAGRGAAGKWTSFQNGFGNLVGARAPWLTG